MNREFSHSSLEESLTPHGLRWILSLVMGFYFYVTHSTELEVNTLWRTLLLLSLPFYTGVVFLVTRQGTRRRARLSSPIIDPVWISLLVFVFHNEQFHTSDVFVFIPFGLISLFFGQKAQVIRYVVSALISFAFLFIAELQIQGQLSSVRIVDFVLQTGLFVFLSTVLVAVADQLEGWRRSLREQEEVLHTQKTIAEERLALRESFLTTMSHELRTPLNGIIGMSSLLLESKLNDEQRDYAQTVRYSAENLSHLVNDILDMSKIKSGTFKFHPSTFDPIEKAQLVVRNLGVSTQDKSIELKTIFEPNIPPRVIGDVNRFMQVLYNVVGNGVKFTQKGEVRLTMAAEERDGRCVLRIDVWDSGIGIPPDELKYIFDEYHQTEESTSKNLGGTGLGLPITKRLVDLFGGSISVESTLGQGSCFHLSIPMEYGPNPSVEPHGQALELDLNSPQPVLIVDDNTINLELLARMIRRYDVPCEESGDSLHGEQLLHERSFSLVFLDQQMPGLSGIELCKKLRNSPGPNQNTPVILVSGLDSASLSDQLEGVSDVEIMPKPLRLHQIEEVLGKYRLH